MCSSVYRSKPSGLTRDPGRTPAAPQLDWLNEGVFISVGARQADGVIYETYLVERRARSNRCSTRAVGTWSMSQRHSSSSPTAADQPRGKAGVDSD
jgi:hypothetical protein